MYLHSVPVKMAAKASKVVWKLSLLTTEMWQETSLDIQKNKEKASSSVLLARKSRILNEKTWHRLEKNAQGTAFEAKGRLYTKTKVIERLFVIDLYFSRFAIDYE